MPLVAISSLIALGRRAYLLRLAAVFLPLPPFAPRLRPNALILLAALCPSARNCATVKREYLWSIICRRNLGGTVTTCAPARAASWTLTVSRMLPTMTLVGMSQVFNQLAVRR